MNKSKRIIERVVLTSLVWQVPRCQMWLTMNKVTQKSNGMFMRTWSKKKKKIPPVCKLCHQKGDKMQYSGKCLLSTNLTSKYYKPESVGA